MNVLLSDNDSDWETCKGPTVTKGGNWHFECGCHPARYVRIQVNNIEQKTVNAQRQSTFVKVCHLQNIKIYEGNTRSFLVQVTLLINLNSY